MFLQNQISTNYDGNHIGVMPKKIFNCFVIFYDICNFVDKINHFNISIS